MVYKSNENITRLNKKNIYYGNLAACLVSYIEIADFKATGNEHNLFILTSNHSAITPLMAVAIFSIFVDQMRTKPILESVKRHCVSSVTIGITKNYC